MLLSNLKVRRAHLEAALSKATGHLGFEDPVYRARFFLEMAVRYGYLEEPPTMLPSGYAAPLCLFGLR